MLRDSFTCAEEAMTAGSRPRCEGGRRGRGADKHVELTRTSPTPNGSGLGRHCIDNVPVRPALCEYDTKERLIVLTSRSRCVYLSQNWRPITIVNGM